jgi:hypothetical protein
MPLSTRRIATAATALAMSVLGLSGFGGAATASAADATLTINAVGGNTCQDSSTGRILDYLVEVHGQVNSYYPFGYRIRLDLWGDDQWDDDHQYGPEYITYRYGPTYYDVLFCVDGDTLDEDWGEDEIYAKLLFQDLSTGRNVESATSNVVDGHY